MQELWHFMYPQAPEDAHLDHAPSEVTLMVPRRLLAPNAFWPSAKGDEELHTIMRGIEKREAQHPCCRCSLNVGQLLTENTM